MNKQYWSSIKTADEQQPPPPQRKNKPQNQQPKFMNKYGNW